VKNDLGGLRRSHVVTTYGPGAIIDFRSPKEGAPLSGVLAGLDEWDGVAFGRGGLKHPQTIHEPRLERRLKVQGFRLPPVKPGRRERDDGDATDVLPVVRFPRWLQCPECNRLDVADAWNGDPNQPERWCARHAGDDKEKVWVVPVRFIAACEDGHLEEFPWRQWCGCKCQKMTLRLETKGAGLGGKTVRCASCGASRSLEGVFSKQAMPDVSCFCSGARPWIEAAAPAERCGKPLRVLQRGASNVYWGDTRSALDIPPFSPDPGHLFGPYWPTVRDADPEDLPLQVKLLSKKLPEPYDVLMRAVEAWVAVQASDPDEENVLVAEYKQFQRALTEPVREEEFQTRPERCPSEFATYFEGVALARRLREVRAQVGFTRISPPAGMFRAGREPPYNLSRAKLPWLPAIELRGEGIFLAFREDAVKKWEDEAANPRLKAHFDPLAARVLRELVEEARTPDEVAGAQAKFAEWRKVGPRYVMLHSFSHALMRQLSLACGYSSSALRERLYVDPKHTEMMGVLIHTDSPDSEGTLGGLVRQGSSERLRDAIVALLYDAWWCSSDPVCITGTMTLSTPRNGAACHACLLAPETSCEQFNTLLDRALLVGPENAPEVGFFREFLKERP